MALADVSWGSWSYGSNNGMRVGFAVYWSAVSSSSSSVTATVETWTGNQYNHDDSQVLTYSGGLSGTTSYVNKEGTGTSTLRSTKTYTYTYTTYGGSPGTVTFTASVSGVYSGATPSRSVAYVIPGRPYSAPGTPSVTIGQGVANCSGNQTDPTKDKFWQYTDWQIETNDAAWSNWNLGAAGTRTSETYTGGGNSRMRARVRARNANATGAYGTSGYFYGATTAVSPFVASRPTGSTIVLLMWTNTARYSGSIRIARRLDTGAWETIKTLSGSATSTTDIVPLASIASYVVHTDTPQGVNKATASSIQSSIGRGYSPPAAPTSVVLTRISDSEMSFSVTGNQTNPALDSYWEHIEYQVAVGGGAYGSSVSMAGATLNGSLLSLAANQRYRVRVRSTNVAGESGWTVSNYSYTTPATPVGSAVRQTNVLQVLLSASGAGTWADLIRVERSTNNGASWADIGSFAPGATMIDNLGASRGWYRFRAQTPAPIMQSAWSETVDVAASFASDKSKIPGVTRIYAGVERVRQVLVGASRIWTDGD